ncbi:MAG: processing protein [Blastocatellia bacterium]
MSQHNQMDLFGQPITEKVLLENDVHLLALTEIQGIGSATARSFFEMFDGDLSRVWSAQAEELYEGLRKSRAQHPINIVNKIHKDSAKLIELARDRLRMFKERRKISVIFRDTPEYPVTLLDLPNPPAWIFVQGDSKLLHNTNLVAVVGTRTPTENGIEAAKRLSILLVTNGALILSGLAEGIDEVGHRTAVDHGVPTVSVLGHGIDIVFPRSTAALRQQIIDVGGAVVTEYLPRDSYNAERFVQRNRIQAALSQAVAIVEGKTKSGTAHTVRFAKQLKRPLFGVRIGRPTKSPNQELLEELSKNNAPVFDLDALDTKEALTKFMHEHLSLGNNLHAPAKPSRFRMILKELDRIIEYYGANDADYQYLIDEIDQRRKGSKKDAN